MMLVRLSGHSGAGKSRLTAALPKHGVQCPRAVIYTSRLARDDEVHGKDYYFLSRSAIAALPSAAFFVGPVREMLQAVDLDQLEQDIRSNDVVLIEIFHALWPELELQVKARVGNDLRTASVFMTAVDPDHLRSLPDDNARGEHIRTEVTEILTIRAKDEESKIKKRAASAVDEILTAIGPDGAKQYARVFHSSPEGPDKNDDWTREAAPIGRAKEVLNEFVRFVKDHRGA